MSVPYIFNVIKTTGDKMDPLAIYIDIMTSHPPPLVRHVGRPRPWLGDIDDDPLPPPPPLIRQNADYHSLQDEEDEPMEENEPMEVE